jgi:hypothetical protein
MEGVDLAMGCRSGLISTASRIDVLEYFV